MADENGNLAQLQAILEHAKAGWQAGVTSVSELSAAEQNLLLGYNPEGDEESLETREQVAKAKMAAFDPAVMAEIGYPASFDLRNVGGKCFVTPIKNQGGCGSCVAFGTAATVEGTLKAQRNNPNLKVDLSEAHLFYCYARDQGRRCNNGWWMGPALDACKVGVVDEACFPYTAGDQTCKLCSDWRNRVTKIKGWHKITSHADMKTWISTKRAPLVAAFTVYADFFSYKSGIYKHVTGGVRGGHCVSCIGYNDAQKYWIIENSWGPGWGESGYFRIAYGDCGIDSTMWAVDGVAETGWRKGKMIRGLWTIDQTRNAWVYVGGLGWRKISRENDNIFFVMLTQLATAKAAKRPVNLYEDNGVIKQIYVL